MNSYFIIVGTQDNPLYEAEFGPLQKEAKKDEYRHLNQFILHSSLDIIDELQYGTNQKYLKIVDKFNEWNVSGYVLPSGIKFLLLHDQQNVDGIRNFFSDCHELYIKVLLNPFMDLNQPVSSSIFDQRVKANARKWLALRITPLFRTFATRKYTPDHEWISVTNGIGTFGITDYAQTALGDVVYIEVPSIGDVVKEKDQIGAVESVKAASDIYSPVSGEIVEINEKLQENPGLINTSPYVDGWIAKIKLANEGELEALMDEKAYEEHTK
ncbi:hypothetical protein HDV04_000567 [Boothiomyces sp. JEL0838]|nr:hypothetical protein HDV04_000567 [Boothiomyces sp. JEL0838]